MRSPWTKSREQLHLPQLEKAWAHSNEDPVQPKKKKRKKENMKQNNIIADNKSVLERHNHITDQN